VAKNLGGVIVYYVGRSPKGERKGRKRLLKEKGEEKSQEGHVEKMVFT